ncbi:MAG: hypothetical protein PWQ94_1101 [Thermoanaerobacterium sp.]|nr:hypothetical protein [Thermoanaerobacterium sp.]
MFYQTWYINTCRCESSGGKVPQNTRKIILTEGNECGNIDDVAISGEVEP